MGLEKIHAIAKNADYVLKIQLSDWGDDLATIRLPFRLGGAETEYSLQIREVGTFSPLESSLGSDVASGLPFSTRDHDNDHKRETNCAKHLSGEMLERCSCSLVATMHVRQRLLLTTWAQLAHSPTYKNIAFPFVPMGNEDFNESLFCYALGHFAN